MQLHQLQAKTKRRRSRQVGRGGKRGTTAGRGTKGQKARAGHKMRPELRDIIKKLPKRRGRGKNSNKTIETKILVVEVATLAPFFKKGEEVSLKTLREKGILSRHAAAVKLVGGANLKEALTIKGLVLSVPARAAVEGAGGKIV